MSYPRRTRSTLAAIAHAYDSHSTSSVDIAARVEQATQASTRREWRSCFEAVRAIDVLDDRTITRLEDVVTGPTADTGSLPRTLLGYSAVVAGQLTAPDSITQPVDESRFREALSPQRTDGRSRREALLDVAVQTSESALLHVLGSDTHSEPSGTRLATECTQYVDPPTVARPEQRAALHWTRDQLLSYSPAQFEHLIAHLLAAIGYETAVSQYSKDNGIDVFAATASGHGAVVQAKRYAPSNPVSVGAVQRLRGTVAELDMPRGLLVTSSDFTAPAVESAQRMDRLSLLSGTRLVSLLNRSPLVPST